VYCAGVNATVKSIELRPIREISVSRHSLDGHEKPIVVGNLHGWRRVGYNYAAVKGGIFADSSFAWISRYGMVFDVRSPGLIGHRVVAAHLSVTVVPYGPESRPDCTNSVGFGTSDWWNEGWPEGSFGTSADSTLLAGKLTVEATNIVSIWMAGRFNQGIILRNEDENLNVFTTKRCETYYRDPILTINYY